MCLLSALPTLFVYGIHIVPQDKFASLSATESSARYQFNQCEVMMLYSVVNLCVDVMQTCSDDSEVFDTWRLPDERYYRVLPRYECIILRYIWDDNLLCDLREATVRNQPVAWRFIRWRTTALRLFCVHVGQWSIKSYCKLSDISSWSVSVYMLVFFVSIVKSLNVSLSLQFTCYFVNFLTFRDF
jgi:hypothetical protein